MNHIFHKYLDYFDGVPNPIEIKLEWTWEHYDDPALPTEFNHLKSIMGARGTYTTNDGQALLDLSTLRAIVKQP